MVFITAKSNSSRFIGLLWSRRGHGVPWSRRAAPLFCRTARILRLLHLAHPALRGCNRAIFCGRPSHPAHHRLAGAKESLVSADFFPTVAKVELPLVAAPAAAEDAGRWNTLDMKNLSAGERIVMFASAALVILSFVPLWASISVEGTLGFEGISENGNAWDAYGFLVKLGIILAIVALGLTIANMTGKSVSTPPFTYAALGAAATVLLVIGVLTGPEDGGLGALGAAAVGVDISRGILLFVGAVLAAAIAVGGYMHMQGEGATTGYRGAATPPPPPA